MFTNDQIKWATQHDWFLSANWSTGSVSVCESVCGPAGHWTDKVVTFTDYAALRRWAGY